MRLGPLFLLIGLFLLVGCGFHESPPSWEDQLVPDSPCYRVNLLDGLSEDDTSELHDLFDCIDQGAFTPLAPLMDALDEPDRAGTPAGVDLARLINHLPATGLDLAAILDAAIQLLQDDRAPLLAAAELAVELLYARPYEQVAWGGPSAEQSALDQGVLVPALPLLGDLAGLALDRDDDLAGLWAQILRGATTADAVATFLAAAGAADGPLATASAELLPDLGAAILACEDTSNDHTAADGHGSLEVLADALLEEGSSGGTPLEAVLAPAAIMLGDEAAVSGLQAALAQAAHGGHLAPLPAQFAILATEDVDGGSLDPGEDSALVSLVRLLHLGHREVSCSTLGVEWLHEDDLSVWLLELMADQEPTNVDFLLHVGGWTLSFGDLVEALASQCTVDSTQFAADAPALTRLVDPEVGDLLVVLLELLDGLGPEGGQSRVPELVALIDAVHVLGLSAPVEELLKDLTGTRLMALAMDLVPALVDPWSSQTWCADGGTSCPSETWSGYDEADFSGGRHPVDLEDLLGLVPLLVAEDGEGRVPLARLLPSARLAVRREATWTCLDRLAVLLTTPGAESAGLLARLPDWQAVDPDWRLLSTAADLLEDEAVTTPVLRIAEIEAVRTELATTSPAEAGPLPFLAELVTDGTLAEVLTTVKLILDLLLEARL
jgi:hypothetical protein